MGELVSRGRDGDRIGVAQRRAQERDTLISCFFQRGDPCMQWRISECLCKADAVEELVLGLQRPARLRDVILVLERDGAGAAIARFAS